MVKILSRHSHTTTIEYLINLEACFNALSFNSAKQLGQIDYSDKVKLSSFNGTLSDSMGSMFVDLLIGKSLYRAKFYIIETLSVSGIIGAEI